jgi:hypothetical protein
LKEEGYNPVLYIVMLPKHHWQLDNKPVYHTVIRVNDKMLDNRYPEPREWSKGIKGSRYTHVVPYPDQVWLKKVIRINSP